MSAHVEIERRFLVDGRTEKPWRSEAKRRSEAKIFTILNNITYKHLI